MDEVAADPATRIVAALEKIAASAYEEGFGHAAASICALADVLAATQFASPRPGAMLPFSLPAAE
ncbi:hypothetical protein [Muricoccus pecuniae]|uniref:Uncharacterized protein n=1 Tax=Muricoccus pecuniae TaxID=693023 RepID=A0A840XXV9_9PROT|nr:hypothetical protein [Roseomonas pecuniae]MBB5692070.1 hypothetical protein [Roseomonas pecuniae]